MGFITIFATIYILCSGLALSQPGPDNSDKTDDLLKLTIPSPEVDSPRGWYNKAGIAVDNEYCAAIGKSILVKNGTVVDAGIATLFCNGVVDQAHMGLGGGTILMVHASPKSGGPKETVYISADDRAPMWVDEDTCEVASYDWPYQIKRDKDGKVVAWNTFRNIAIGVPGELAGYYTAWQRYGTLAWSELVEPSVALARNGFKVTVMMEKIFELFQPQIKATQAFKDLFTKAKNIFYSKGETMTDPVLANMLEKVSQDPESFYKGDLAKDISADIRDYGGMMPVEDLKSYEPRLLDPITFPMLGGRYTAHVPPQPFGGAMMVFVYNIMESYGMTREDVSTPEGMALFYHRYTEAWKFAYGTQACFGDDYHKYKICRETMSNLLNRTYAEEVKSKINDGRVQDDVTNYLTSGQDSVTSHGTSHLSVVAKDGSTFMATSSVNSELGCKNKGSRTGIIFNDRLTDFTRKTTNEMDSDVNTNIIGPGKQGRSFRVPLLITDENGNTVLALGGSGGSRIMTSVLQDAIFHLHFGLDLKSSIDFPRMSLMPYYPEFPILTDKFLPAIVEELLSKGQNNVEVYPSYDYTSVSQGVSLIKCNRCQNGNHHRDCMDLCIEAVSDYRKGGQPDGI